jgi:DNA-binding transcriptional ArsR family regulator
MPKTPALESDEQIYEMQVRICKSFANPVRLRMLDLLAQREYAASDLQLELGITAPNLSQHLAILKGAGVVATRRNGKQTLCSLAIPEVKQACHLIRNVLRAQLRNGRKLVI